MASLFNFPSNNLRNQFLNKILQSSTSSFLTHDIHHSLSNLPNLCRLRISRLLDLIRLTSRKRNDKNSQKISVRSFDIGMGFNKSLPFTNKRFEFIRGEGHSGEIRKTVFALDFVDAEFNFTKSVILIVLEVC